MTSPGEGLDLLFVLILFRGSCSEQNNEGVWWAGAQRIRSKVRWNSDEWGRWSDGAFPCCPNRGDHFSFSSIVSYKWRSTVSYFTLVSACSALLSSAPDFFFFSSLCVIYPLLSNTKKNSLSDQTDIHPRFFIASILMGMVLSRMRNSITTPSTATANLSPQILSETLKHTWTPIRTDWHYRASYRCMALTLLPFYHDNCRYNLQTMSDPEETWKDLRRLGYDSQLKKVMPSE